MDGVLIITLGVALMGGIVIALIYREEKVKEKETHAAELYWQGKLSLEKAAESAGISSKWELLTMLNKRVMKNNPR